MKISEANLNELTDDELERLVFGYPELDRVPHCQAALVLGNRNANADRTPQAVSCYTAGLCDKLVLSGGAVWEADGETLTEAEMMFRYCRDRGVPESDLIKEELSQTTIENMLCGALMMQRSFEYVSNVKNLLLITSEYHMRRSFLLAKALLPRNMNVFCCPAKGLFTRDNWQSRDSFRTLVSMEAFFMQEQIVNGLTEDGEF